MADELSDVRRERKARGRLSATARKSRKSAPYAGLGPIWQALLSNVIFAKPLRVIVAMKSVRLPTRPTILMPCAWRVTS
jgi:hypothetical protein